MLDRAIRTTFSLQSYGAIFFQDPSDGFQMEVCDDDTLRCCLEVAAERNLVLKLNIQPVETASPEGKELQSEPSATLENNPAPVMQAAEPEQKCEPSANSEGTPALPTEAAPLATSAIAAAPQVHVFSQVLTPQVNQLGSNLAGIDTGALVSQITAQIQSQLGPLHAQIAPQINQLGSQIAGQVAGIDAAALVSQITTQIQSQLAPLNAQIASQIQNAAAQHAQLDASAGYKTTHKPTYAKTKNSMQNFTQQHAQQHDTIPQHSKDRQHAPRHPTCGTYANHSCRGSIRFSRSSYNSWNAYSPSHSLCPSRSRYSSPRYGYSDGKFCSSPPDVWSHAPPADAGNRLL